MLKDISKVVIIITGVYSWLRTEVVSKEGIRKNKMLPIIVNNNKAQTIVWEDADIIEPISYSDFMSVLLSKPVSYKNFLKYAM
ncbi:hypothetical protein [Heliorestis convoluta]|uniref:Uncharacterized protein n=1 Tax=Heliorestis convoluta TaxID=356322 RepID=A0A5Q2N725_9FIRM|nr:hypothetical protein [Heliorestis convoluta]QGG48070.1 hypothetical protein FTV88_1972 [Heliorestis convoluta]